MNVNQTGIEHPLLAAIATPPILTFSVTETARASALASIDVIVTETVNVSAVASIDVIVTETVNISALASIDVTVTETVNASAVAIAEPHDSEVAEVLSRISQFDIIFKPEEAIVSYIGGPGGVEEAIVSYIGGPGGVEKVGAFDSISSLTVSIPALPRYPGIPKPVFPIAITPIFQEGETITYVDGREQRILGVDEPRLKIRLRYEFLSEADKNSIFAFFIARRGQAGTFYWVNPIDPNIERAYIVRFEDDIISQEYFAHKLWNFNEVSFVETFWRSP